MKAAVRTTLPTLGQICASPDDYLAKLDVAAINLICASGLPGAEVVSLDENLAWLDEVAKKVRLATEENYEQFLGNPGAFDGSQAKFCIRILITVLQRQCGVRYHPKWQGITPGSPIPPDFGRSAVDLFIPSIIDGAGGTCGSLPVLYVAVGRRLGYPLQLVKAYRHLFVRWDDALGERWFHPDRFNLEATGPGVHFLPNDHYRKWPVELPNEDVQAGIFLKSLSPREELAEFVAGRGYCLQSNGRLTEAIQALAWAKQLAPHNRFFAQSHYALSMHLTMQRREHAFLNATTPRPFSNNKEWPKGPHWVRGNDGREWLVQVLDHGMDSLFSKSKMPGDFFSPRSLVSCHVQLPNGRLAMAEVPQHDWSDPLVASWVELSGNCFALVHRPLEFGWTPASETYRRQSREMAGKPILPGNSNERFGIGHPHFREQISSVKPWEESLVQQLLQTIRNTGDRDESTNRLPVPPIASLPPGPLPPPLGIGSRTDTSKAIKF